MTVFSQDMWHLKATVKCCFRQSSPYVCVLFIWLASNLCSFCLVGFSAFRHISQFVSLNALPMARLTSVILWSVNDWLCD